ncbi:hypothetical protein SCOCK_40182 [Actinacidiphila cocklensis]|uniref:Uncharacterized protein n=1 Tax=Actinacidiphila cocklensis TaxID=887465 RepID=A0A9W4GV18_9ACTN|nr:hypothetical protein SCOCK_40182 [Actinacidiphila cocklensis]
MVHESWGGSWDLRGDDGTAANACHRCGSDQAGVRPGRDAGTPEHPDRQAERAGRRRGEGLAQPGGERLPGAAAQHQRRRRDRTEDARPRRGGRAAEP